MGTRRSEGPVELWDDVGGSQAPTDLADGLLEPMSILDQGEAQKLDHEKGPTSRPGHHHRNRAGQKPQPLSAMLQGGRLYTNAVA